MNLNYAIFRCQPINTINDLAQIGSHNKREKKAYKSNPNIDISKSKDNIELVPLSEKYVKGFYEITKEYRKEHEKRMKTMRDDRKKTFRQMLDTSKSVVADELILTASHGFFENMSKEEVKKWAETCMDFVYQDLGYKKEQVLHATVHMDEKSPHVHCVVVPLVRKLDKRTNTERYTISKKQYIKDKIHMSQLQDKFHARMVNNGYDLERGIKGSDDKHIQIKEYKKITRKLNHELNASNGRLDKAMTDFEDKMKTNKNLPFDKKHVIVEKETFDSMNKVIKESKKVMELQPKLEQVFDEVDYYSKDYKRLKYDNNYMEKEINSLTERNQELEKENNKLKSYISAILQAIKTFFRKILLHGNEESKDIATGEIKDYYDNKDFDLQDVYKISRGTSKEDELFDYADIPSRYKTYEKSSHRDRDDYEMSL